MKMTHHSGRAMGAMGGALVVALAMMWNGAAARGQEKAAPAWTDVSGKFGSPVCLAVAPGGGFVVAGVMKNGYFGSHDGGATWDRLGDDKSQFSGSLCTDALFDPKDPKTFWTSGAYARSIFKTTDGGKTFQPASALWHMDNIAVDFSDPERKTLMSAMHETPGRLYRSTDAGKTWWNIGKERVGYEGFPKTLGVISPVILDSKTYIMGCQPSWLAAHGFKPGIAITDDGGETWTKVSDYGPVGHPLVATDGTIYWSDRTVIKSADKGKTWQAVTGVTVTPTELPGGKLLSARDRQLYVSSDKGATWEKYGENCRENIHAVVYDSGLKAAFVLARGGNGPTHVYRLDMKD